MPENFGSEPNMRADVIVKMPTAFRVFGHNEHAYPVAAHKR